MGIIQKSESQSQPQENLEVNLLIDQLTEDNNPRSPFPMNLKNFLVDIHRFANKPTH